ncbi:MULTISPECIES: NTP transferase domain-containing protein [unclassified Rhodococcus (in: high G+C Gram-positive bacteria)]|uniref:NTP transferase domain-containing protein n=1 Tax=unclassified Rhodococcus (in: high G+C Gram-positive bacteria) TaxID=192944 RepID=UPI00163AFB8A|nr:MULTISPECIES: NTP transferase domain-containing protein [unclassified Rhodococcus (in: high G+C Gram-positive bacteria)]MBC2643576.1 NTP transferase domain-containing protein [Rhodococcus sp. 3A]MBC2891683.1 NTP transferase domain-containing protein [Rhodococcus sp. 4CII]
MNSAAPVHAIVLAGGRATRMGGVDKPAVVVGGRRMLDTALDAVDACARVVVVGPRRADLDSTVLQTQETPPGTGPVAGVAAGLAVLDADPADRVILLASDLPFVEPATVGILAAAVQDVDTVFAVDEKGRLQFLLSAWRVGALTDRIRSLGSAVNQPMKALVPATFDTVPVRGVTDCDTPDDVERARSGAAAVPLTIEEARNAILATVPPLPPRSAELATALGATLAEPLLAAEALPRIAVSAMDGYAVAGEGPWVLRDAIRYAGSSEELELADGEAARIATGAHLPLGATTVVRDEFALTTDTSDGPRLSRREGTPVRGDARRRGEDWQERHRLAAAGTAVTPALLSAAASAEVTTAGVRGPVRAHVVVTGDEIRREGPLRRGQTRDALGPVLPQFLSSCGIRTVADTHLRDTSDSFDELFREVRRPDLIVIVGATGGGAADQLRAALDRAEARVVVGRVRCRPGGSQVTALLPDGRVVLGLPGNPYAAVATLLTTVPSIAAALTGRTPAPTQLGRIANASEVSGDAARILPAVPQPDGTWRVDAGIRTAHLAGLIDRDALALVPAGAVDGDLAELVPLPR